MDARNLERMQRLRRRLPHRLQMCFTTLVKVLTDQPGLTEAEIHRTVDWCMIMVVSSKEFTKCAASRVLH
jgi:hypothetical protein